MRSLLPRTLTARLVITAVALVALVSLLMAGATTLAMNSYLTSRLDESIRATAQVGMPRGGPASAETDVHRDGDDAVFQGAQGARTLRYELNSGRGGILQGDGEVTSLAAPALRELRRVPRTGTAHTLHLADVGDYRVMVVRDPGGDTVAVGLPTSDLQATTENLLLVSSLLALGGVAVAAVLGTFLVRRQLRPLRAVAATADDVTALPLGSGDQSTEMRVPSRYTDPATEVGHVGMALNTLLDHVDSALEARRRSEQQVRQFVADASHELRTPLSTIHGYAELSRRTPDDAPALTRALAKVETEATRMSALVEDLLMLARLDAGRPLERTEVDVTRLLLEAVADARVVAPDHRWRLALPDEPVTVCGDALALHQVVTNLISNARRHTPSGTTVTVGAVVGRTVLLTVHDDGPGVPADLQPEIFDRFTRGDSSRTRDSGGAGLGLSIVEAITRAHGGTARLDTHPGSTTFTIELPRTRPSG